MTHPNTLCRNPRTGDFQRHNRRLRTLAEQTSRKLSAIGDRLIVKCARRMQGANIPTTVEILTHCFKASFKNWHEKCFEFRMMNSTTTRHLQILGALTLALLAGGCLSKSDSETGNKPDGNVAGQGNSAPSIEGSPATAVTSTVAGRAGPQWRRSRGV